MARALRELEVTPGAPLSPPQGLAEPEETPGYPPRDSDALKSGALQTVEGRPLPGLANS